MNKLHESLKEFNDAGPKLQLATPSEKTWKTVWKSHVSVGSDAVVFIEAGFTSTTSDSHTAVINVTVKPLKLQNGAEDMATETITIYYKDFSTPKEAADILDKIRISKKINEEDPGVPSQEQSLGIQLYTQSVAPTIAF